MAAKSSSPVLGALCQASHPKKSANSEEKDQDSAGPKVSDDQRITAADVSSPQAWTISVGYRFQPSSRHFVGDVEQKQREVIHNQIQNVAHLFDIGIERQVSRRFAASVSIPLVFEYRNQLYNPRGVYRVHGVGDVTVGGRYWLFRPPTENGGNVAIGVSLKIPTGKDDATGHALDARGNPVIAVADQSIQAGDGGWGFSVDLQAYRPLALGTMGYVTGSYLFNPMNTNGVSTGRTTRDATVMSVSDQFLARVGFARAIPQIPGFIVTMGGRMEGVPVRDMIGGSDGFRRPGYAISGDPGFLLAIKGNVFSCNVPWAIYRKRPRSVPDLLNGSNGDAAFADYLVTIGFSRRF